MQCVGESRIPELSGETEQGPALQLPLAELWEARQPPPCASCPPRPREALSCLAVGRAGAPAVWETSQLPREDGTCPGPTQHSARLQEGVSEGVRVGPTERGVRRGPQKRPSEGGGRPSCHPPAELGGKQQLPCRFGGRRERPWPEGSFLLCGRGIEEAQACGALRAASVWAPWRVGARSPTGDPACLPACSGPRPRPPALPSASPDPRLSPPDSSLAGTKTGAPSLRGLLPVPDSPSAWGCVGPGTDPRRVQAEGGDRGAGSGWRLENIPRGKTARPGELAAPSASQGSDAAQQQAAGAAGKVAAALRSLRACVLAQGTRRVWTAFEATSRPLPRSRLLQPRHREVV